MALPKPATHAMRMTEEEYFALGDSKPYAEYLDGIVVRKAMPNRDHFDIADEILGALRDYRSEHGGRSGPEPRILFETLTGRFYRLPDVAYWAAGRDRGPNEAMHPPTLAVEIRSPSETIREQREKCEFMHENGVDVCWLIDPERRTVSVLEGGSWRELGPDEALASVHLPGLELPVANLWALLDEPAQA